MSELRLSGRTSLLLCNRERILNAVKANIFHAELIVNELYMVANILSVQLEGMIVADSELPGKISRNGFCIFIYYDFHMHLTRAFTICLTLC